MEKTNENNEESTIIYSESFSLHNNITGAELKGTLIHHVKDGAEFICISAHFIKTEKDKVGITLVPLSDPCSPKIIGMINENQIVDAYNFQMDKYVEIAANLIRVQPSHYEGDFITEIPCNHSDESGLHHMWIVLDHLDYPGDSDCVGKLSIDIIWSCKNNEHSD